jgi:hypothetical protein
MELGSSWNQTTQCLDPSLVALIAYTTGNEGMPCVIMFAMHFLSGARQNLSLPFVFLRAHDKYLHTVSTLFAARFPIDAGQTFVFAVRFPTDARQYLFPNVWGNRPLAVFTDVNLCRAPWHNAQ